MSGYSTAYIGSSNLTQSAQVLGLEWNVRVSAARNPDAVAKMAAVFTSYWESRDFTAYDAAEFARRTQCSPRADELTLLSPIELELRPFQEALLEHVVLARHRATIATCWSRRPAPGRRSWRRSTTRAFAAQLGRSRLLFVAHREEILDQSRATFRHALRDAAFGEKWVGGQRPELFEHVFASIQSLHSADVRNIDPAHFDIVIVDEFHHAAAPSYEALLDHSSRSNCSVSPRRPSARTASTCSATSTAGSPPSCGCGTRSTRSTSHRSRTLGFTTASTCATFPWRRGQGYDVAALEGRLHG